jgi:hypothetical protein
MKKRLLTCLFCMSLALIFTGGWVAAAHGTQLTAQTHTSLKPLGSTANRAWRQTNQDGFGNLNNNSINALEPFQGGLYAGTSNENSGAQLWRSQDGATWSQVAADGFSDTFNDRSYNASLNDLQAYNGYLYASTYSTGTNGGEVWRSPNGTNWELDIYDGFGDHNNFEIFQMIVFSDTLYAGTSNESSGAEIWRTTNGIQWKQANPDGFGNANNTSVVGLAVFNDWLYAGTQNATQGAQLWRTNGLSWTPVITAGFGNPDNTIIGALTEFKGDLYALTRNPASGSQVWRSPDGLTWTQVASGGLGDATNTRGYGLKVFDETLFLVTGNLSTGAQVWRSQDGLTWEQIGFGGWDDPLNVGSFWSNSMAVFEESLFVGTIKNWTVDPSGGEVWLYLPHAVYLPLVRE